LDDALDLRVHDAGPRYARHRPALGEVGGHGLTGMRERAAIHHGRVEAGPCEDGFVVTARLPLSEVAPA
jgi:signal transduction histidine kinase